MSVRMRLATYSVVLAVLFGGGWAVGTVVSDDGTDAGGHGHDEGGGSGHDDSSAPGAPGTTDLLGLSSVVDGVRLVVDDHTADTLRFHLERDGAPLLAFDEEQEALLHLLVVRRDLTGYQHLHPAIDDDGTWTAAVDLSVPGIWRVVVDARPTGTADSIALGVDVTVAGDMTPVELGAETSMVHVADLMVHRDGFRFTATTADGAPVDGLAPYLGEAAHLVAFREGDLAYVHLHPETDVLGDVEFAAALPGPGRYRLFLQFVRDGEVVTVPFTVVEP